MEANGISRCQHTQYMFGRCLPFSLSLSSLIKSTMAKAEPPGIPHFSLFSVNLKNATGDFFSSPKFSSCKKSTRSPVLYFLINMGGSFPFAVLEEAVRHVYGFCLV